MIIKPKTRGFICTTAHPEGCKQHIIEQIDYIRSRAKDELADAPKNVLVIGCSTGYGLASRIACSFGFKANTLGVMFEKAPTAKRTASAGWYNTMALEQLANDEGITTKTLNVDAFSHEAKQTVIEALQADFGPIDLVVYSLAAPRRKDPNSDQVYSSTLKPIGSSVTMKTLDTDKVIVHDVTLEPANDDEIAQTIKVMGGEDWELWIEALLNAGVLANGAKTVAYTYIGKSLTWPIYGEASIGKAKEDLDRAAGVINEKLSSQIQGQANVAVLKAVVTQSSSAIPVMPLYISLLYQVMKDKGVHEGCIEQIDQLMTQQLYGNKPLVLDEQRRIRVDLKELADDVQGAVADLWQQVTSENLAELSDFKGYQSEFFKLFGFGFDSVDYSKDVDPTVVES